MSFGPSACALLTSLADRGLLRPGLRTGLLGRPEVLASAWPHALPRLARRLGASLAEQQPLAGQDTSRVLTRLGLACRGIAADTPRGSLEMAANFGVSEHLFDQARAFGLLHDSLAVGGLAVHAVPGGGYAGHGLFRYPLALLRLVAEANGYEVVHLSRTPDKPSAALGFGWPASVETEACLSDPASWLSLAVFRKTRDASFACPQALDTRSFWERTLLAEPLPAMRLGLPCLAGPECPELLTDPSLPLHLAGKGLIRQVRLRLRLASGQEQAASPDLQAVLALEAVRFGRAFGVGF